MADTNVFAAKRNEQTDDMTRRSPLLTPKPHRAVSAQLTSQGLPYTFRAGGGSRHLQWKKPRRFTWKVTGHGACTRRKGRRMRIALDARALAHAESGIGGYTVNLVRGLLGGDAALELARSC